MTYLFDTTAYSHLLRGHSKVARTLNAAELVYIPQVVVAELRYGFRLGSRLEENERLLTRFIASKKIQVLLPDNATTDYFVTIAIHAKRRGVQLSSHDLWIAALAEQWGATLMTFDQDFKHLGYKGVKLQLQHN